VIGWESENRVGKRKRAYSRGVGIAPDWQRRYDDVLRQEIEGARLVLSGNRAERLFYEEYVFQSDTVQALAMEYAAALRSRTTRCWRR
jgi:hypothetical protein